MPAQTFGRIQKAAEDDKYWVSIGAGFAKERALSEFICVSPHLLEDGLRPYPSTAARELVFPDRSRLDVLLLDRDNNIVIVECKQNPPTVDDIGQLRGYMRNAEQLRAGLKVGRDIRGILVHGGARKLNEEVRTEMNRDPRVELVTFSVAVGFAPSA
jgi:RecB family endonuclease NucS